MKIVILDGYAANPGDLDYHLLEKLGEVVVYPRTSDAEKVERAKDADIILLNKVQIDAEMLAQLPKLKYIGIQATGFNVVDIEAARKQGIIVTNIPAYSTDSVAQMTFALILAVTNRVEHYTQENRNERWAYNKDFCYWDTPLMELAGKTLGIMGLVADSVGTAGLSALLGYAQLLGVLIISYGLVAFVMNPFIVYLKTRKNPYPLVWATVKDSGVYAFFTRSSAANIPVNLSLCKRLGLNPDTYTISIPLGATINMSGASITISVLALAAAHTLGLAIDLPTAFLLCIVSSIGACGTSGVAGGSLLLIPVACASFGIGNDISMQVVAVGFIISVLEDACETALNSSSDVLFTATAEFADRRKKGTLRAEDMVPKEK